MVSRLPLVLVTFFGFIVYEVSWRLLSRTLGGLRCLVGFGRGVVAFLGVLLKCQSLLQSGGVKAYNKASSVVKAFNKASSEVIEWRGSSYLLDYALETFLGVDGLGDGGRVAVGVACDLLLARLPYVGGSDDDDGRVTVIVCVARDVLLGVCERSIAVLVGVARDLLLVALLGLLFREIRLHDQAARSCVGERVAERRCPFRYASIVSDPPLLKFGRRELQEASVESIVDPEV